MFCDPHSPSISFRTVPKKSHKLCFPFQAEVFAGCMCISDLTAGLTSVGCTALFFLRIAQRTSTSKYSYKGGDTVLKATTVGQQHVW